MSQSTTTTLYAAIEKTVAAFFQGYEDAVTTVDASHYSKVLAPGCVRHLGPKATLEAFGGGLPTTLGNADYEGMMINEARVLASAKTTVVDLCIDTVKRRAGIRSTYELTIKGKPASHTLEYGWWLTFSEDGTQITQVHQFVDTAGVGQVLPLIMQAAAAGAQ